MFKKFVPVIAFLAVLGISACGNGDKETVTLPSGKKITRQSASRSIAKKVAPVTVTGKVKLVPTPGSENLPEEQRTSYAVVVRENGEYVLPVGQKANGLRDQAGKTVTVKGKLQRDRFSYEGEYYDIVEVESTSVQ